jgi:hypothetical protein
MRLEHSGCRAKHNPALEASLGHEVKFNEACSYKKQHRFRPAAVWLCRFAQDRDDNRSNRDEAGWRSHLFQRFREDLDLVQAATPSLTADEYRLVSTKQDLNELQRKLEDRFDQPQLDRVIGGLEKIVTNNRLSSRDRDMLADDLRRMRDFREHHDAYGARGA